MLSRSLMFRWGHIGWGLALGAVVATACGGSSEKTPFVPGETGTGAKGHAPTGGTAGHSGEGGMGGDKDSGSGATGDVGSGGDAPVDPGAPIVTITSPKAVSDPNAGGVIIENEVEVRCTVTPADNGKSVAASTVSLEMLDADGNAVPPGSVPGDPTGRAGEYGARFTMNDVPDNGRVSFRCTGGDVSSPPRLASDRVDTFVDHGPIITVHEPRPESAHGLKGSVPFAFTVEPSPLAKGDKGAAVGKVQLFVNNVELDSTALHEDNGQYTAEVALSDEALFPTVPNAEVPFLIRAKNVRSPSAVTREVADSFVVDGEGPIVTIDLPRNGGYVGQSIGIRFHASDALSQVDVSTIAVTIDNDKQLLYGDLVARWDDPKDANPPLGADEHIVVFPNTLVQDSIAQTTITIQAQDYAGNVGESPAWTLYLDDVPPIVDLDPANVRVDRKSSSGVECSESFDPLGAAVGDLSSSDEYGFALIRAFIWERTNPSPNRIYSGVDPGTVAFYVLNDTSKALLINNKGDSDPDCDDLDPETRGEKIDLVPVAPTGSAWFTDDGNKSPDPATLPCSLKSDPAPPYLCADESSDLRIVVPQDIPDRPPAVWARAPIDNVFCTGRSWEVKPKNVEGWVCIAARAQDKVGNVGISRPIRVCYDNPETAEKPDCTGEPPSCTDGCALPPTFPEDAGDAFIRP